MEAEIEDSRRDHYLLMTYRALKKPALFLDVYEQTKEDNQKAFSEHVPEQLKQLSARSEKVLTLRNEPATLARGSIQAKPTVRPEAQSQKAGTHSCWLPAGFA